MGKNQYQPIDPEIAQKLAAIAGECSWVFIVETARDHRIDIYNGTKCPEESAALLAFALENVIHSRSPATAKEITIGVIQVLVSAVEKRTQ